MHEDTAKIVLMDGGRNLWGYVNATKLYDDFEKLPDFHHAMEHISQGAEGMFGKGTQIAKRRVERAESFLSLHSVFCTLRFLVSDVFAKQCLPDGVQVISR